MSDGCEHLPRRVAEYIEGANVALSVSEAGADTPLFLVNAAFCRLTGYGRDDVNGRNCRFLQGADTDPVARGAFASFIGDDTADSGRFPIVNYRKDGSRFHNFVFLTRLRAQDGMPRFFLGSQFDMSSTVKRNRIGEHDARLTRSLEELNAIVRDTGLAITATAEMISDSVALLTQLSFADDPA